MIRAVLDTNVLVSGFLSPLGPPARIVDWLRAGSVAAVLDDRIVDEYEEVLKRPELGLPSADVDIVLGAILRNAHWADVSGLDLAEGLPDPDDAAFAECARAARCPLVTGNRRHFPKKKIGEVEVMSPAEFVAAFRRR